jgi:hypothetical protein
LYREKRNELSRPPPVPLRAAVAGWLGRRRGHLPSVLSFPLFTASPPPFPPSVPGGRAGLGHEEPVPGGRAGLGPAGTPRLGQDQRRHPRTDRGGHHPGSQAQPLRRQGEAR